MAQMVKNPPAILKATVRCLDQEDPVEKGMAAKSSRIRIRILWTAGSGGLYSMGSQRQTQLSN